MCRGRLLSRNARGAQSPRARSFLILDLSLGCHDAFDALDLLRQNAFEGSVVLISGHDQETLNHVRRVGLGYGLAMLEAVRKPIDFDALRRLTKPDIPDAPVKSIDFDRVLHQNQLEVWYQPKVSLDHYAPVGFEALVRVRHPDRGLLLPSAFLSQLSERQMGLLNERVVRQVVRDWQLLAEEGFYLKPSINIRARDLRDPRLIELLRTCVPRVDRWPGLLLELNETRLLDDINVIRDAMIRLRLHSIEFAIDDFGSLLRDPSAFRVPLSELNVDRRFVHGCASDPQKRTICKAAAQIARQMKVLSVAEGLRRRPICNA